MNSFERAVDYAEYLVELGKQNPTYLQTFSNTASNKGRSIQQKLLDLYIEETGKQSEDKNLLCNTHLLKKLVRREKLNCLILNLYPGNEGYSLMLRSKTGVETETCKLPYEVTELLDYIDNSELPPFLVDVLEKAQVNVFHNGCVIVEVTDFRRSTNGFDIQYVLLKPTTQTLLCDVNNLTNDGNVWSQEDLFLLESRLLLATEEPLCLDPSPAVVLVANRQQYDRRKLNTPLLKRSVKKYSQATINRKRKFEQSPAPSELKLHDFICTMRENKSGSTQASRNKSSVDSWKFKPVALTAPESVDVEKFAKVIERPKINIHEDNTLNLVEEHILERDGVQDKKLLAKLTIYHRRVDAAYIGQLYLDHDYMEDKSKGATCRYLLGNEDSVNRYLDQFRQIFTEEGRRAVKITSHRPGHPPLVTYTQNAQAVAASSASSQNQNGNKVLSTVSDLQPIEVSQMSTLTMSTHIAPLKRTMPIQLSLSIGTNAVGTQPGQNQMLQQPGSSPVGSQLQMNMQSPLLSQSQFATHRLQQTSQSQSSASQRLKQLGIHTNIASRNNTPTASPVTPQPPLGQMFGSPKSAGNTSMLSQPSKIPSRTPTPTATPPPIMSPPVQTLGLVRKSSLTSTESSTIHHMPQIIHQSNVGTFSQGDSSGTPPCTVSHQPGSVTSLNIANITGIPPNINIQNLTGLPGMNIANLQGLQNMQVSLSLAGGNIAVPINMINTNAVLQNQQLTTTTVNNMQAAMTTVMTLPHSSVITMTSQQGASVTMTPSTQINVTGVLTQSSNVIPGTGMLSLPVSLGGNITQLVPAAMKSQGQLRASASVPLQLQGIQLVNIQQQRAPVKHGGNIQSGQTVGQLVVKPTISVQGPITTILPGQNLGGPGQPVLSPMSLGKSASVGSIATTFTPQQLLQFPQFQAHLQAFQRPPQPQQPQLHFHQILKQSAISTPAAMSFGGKPKNKQLTTPTPPKQ